MILPVLDVLEGNVVRGIAGQRVNYQPIVSRLVAGHRPLDVARAIRDSFGLERFYLADLNGIIHQRPQFDLYRALMADGFELLIDLGLQDSRAVDSMRELGLNKFIVALESCQSPDRLAEMSDMASEITFSLDLFEGTPRYHACEIGWSDKPVQIVDQAVEAGATSILVLDLADVGTGTGVSTDNLCRSIRDTFPNLQIIAGGGIRGPDDVHRLHAIGVTSVLVASALHDRRLSRDDVRSFDHGSSPGLASSSSSPPRRKF